MLLLLFIGFFKSQIHHISGEDECEIIPETWTNPGPDYDYDLEPYLT